MTQKILLYDIETSPNIAYIWGKYEQNALGDFIKEKQIISFAWKWLGEKETHVLSSPMQKGYSKDPENNKELILKLHGLLNEADIVIGHNVDQFDDKLSNTGFLKKGLLPTAPHRTIDTLKVAKKYFSFNSNKLGDLGKFLEVGGKVHTGGFDLWVGCLRGDKAAWARMEEYNKGDVILLEKVYYKLRPWMLTHPALVDKAIAVYCLVCASKNLSKRHASITKKGVRKQWFQCLDCGAWTPTPIKEKKNA